LNIFINQDEIDFTFENEKNLGDIYESIEKWLAPQGFSISEMTLNDKELFLNKKDEWSGLSFNGSETIYFTALTLLELKTQNIETILTYSKMLQAALKEGNLTVLNELLLEYQYIESSYELLLDDKSHTIKNHMKKILEVNGFIPEGERTEQNVIAVLESFIMLDAVIQGRLEELTDPFKAAKDTYDSIQALLPAMEEVSLMLQTGKDKEAMEIIIHFSELFQKLLRIYTNIPHDKIAGHEESLKSFIKEMSGILKELAEAFSSEDSVLMGDLMEYEIMPRMENFPRFFDQIINKGD
jgi:hypothetical protein